MQLTPRILAYVASEEAIGLSAYLDPKGIWTWSLGIAESGGNAVRQYRDNPQPLEACLQAAIALLQTGFVPVLAKAFAGQALAEHQIAGALSFAWRNGPGNLLTAQWVKDVLAGRPTSARASFMQWTDHGRQLARATRERDLFFDARWPADQSDCTGL